MTRRYENEYSSHKVTLQLLEDQESIIAGNSIIMHAREKIKGKILEIGEAIEGQQINTIGITEDKEVAADRAIDAAAHICGYVQAYALDLENNSLYEQFRISRTFMDESPDNVLPAILNDIHDRATDLGDVVVPYGVTSIVLNELSHLITTYQGHINRPRTAIAHRKTMGSTILPALRAIRVQFKKIDKLIVQYNGSDPIFVSDYRNARIIIDLHGPGSVVVPAE